MRAGFSYGAPREKGKKGEKKTFYCDLCYIELNSEDTMLSHMQGMKHLKKEQARQQEARIKGGHAAQAGVSARSFVCWGQMVVCGINLMCI